MKHADDAAYVDAIEAHLRARRGVDHILSPRDFGLARGWWRNGVPLAAVLVGIDRAFESGCEPRSLSFCRRFVEELAACGPTPERRPTPPAESVPLHEIAGLLQTLGDRLADLKLPGAPFEPVLRHVLEVLDLLAVAARPNWSYVRSRLREIDDEVSAAALTSLGPDEVAAFRAEAARAVDRYRGRVDEAALNDAMARFTLQRARERLDLPRVSLL